jgi:hypothetical protein
VGRQPKPRRFPLDRGFLRTAHGQSGDEASAGHSLAVGRTRYIKGRQALRNKYRLQRNVPIKWGLASCLKAILRASPTGELRPKAIKGAPQRFILDLLLCFGSDTARNRIHAKPVAYCVSCQKTATNRSPGSRDWQHDATGRHKTRAALRA